MHDGEEGGRTWSDPGNGGSVWGAVCSSEVGFDGGLVMAFGVGGGILCSLGELVGLTGDGMGWG